MRKGNGRSRLFIVEAFCMECGARVFKRARNLVAHPATFCNRQCAGAFRSRVSAARFYHNTKAADRGCLEWTGCKSIDGYGHARYFGKPKPAHVVAWQLKHGPVPAGMFVCHKCDNPSCISLSHLFLGSPAQNTADMCKKGRQFHKVTGEMAAEIRRSSEPARIIAARLGVARRTITRYRTGDRRDYMPPSRGVA